MKRFFYHHRLLFIGLLFIFITLFFPWLTLKPLSYIAPDWLEELIASLTPPFARYFKLKILSEGLDLIEKWLHVTGLGMLPLAFAFNYDLFNAILFSYLVAIICLIVRIPGHLFKNDMFQRFIWVAQIIFTSVSAFILFIKIPSIDALHLTDARWRVASVFLGTTATYMPILLIVGLLILTSHAIVNLVGLGQGSNEDDFDMD